jgi:hypothetical protein
MTGTLPQSPNRKPVPAALLSHGAPTLDKDYFWPFGFAASST